MNTFQIMNMMYEIQRDYTGMGRKIQACDSEIKNFLIRAYNITEMDWEEIKELWIEWLEKGSLSVSNQIENAQKRILREEKLRKAQNRRENITA